MEAKMLRSLPWVKVENWEDLPISKGIFFKWIAQKDVDCFVQNIFRDIARKLQLPYEKVINLLKEENTPFYEMEKEIFEAYKYVEEDSHQLRNLQKLLRVPDVNYFEGTRSNILGQCLEMFNSLSNVDKVQFLAQVGVTLEINVEDPNAIQEELES